MDYIYLEQTQSFCPSCMTLLSAKIVTKNNKVFINKYCKKHGDMSHILEEDYEYYKTIPQYCKPGKDCQRQTIINKGCPFDCGLCPDHEQHTCIGLIEVTDKCDLGCKFCYASSGVGHNLSLSSIEKMMDFYQESENKKAEILQISGGEPTMHPNILEILQMAKDKKFKYVMLNTNGLRIAKDEAFVKELSKFKGRFEIYLQFDGFSEKTFKTIRGVDLREVKKKAIENLTKYKIPITLVATIVNGVNDEEIGEIINLGFTTKYIRGINFQPLAFFGRMSDTDVQNRITLTGILKRIESQTSGMLKVEDFVPLPCHPERVSFTYLYKTNDKFIPITRHVNAKNVLPLIDNTFTFYPEDIMKKISGGFFTCDAQGCAEMLTALSKMIPKNFTFMSEDSKFDHIDDKTFRISAVSFVDAYNFDMKSVKKECVHIITPNLKKMPFSAYNMIHRKYADYKEHYV